MSDEKELEIVMPAGMAAIDVLLYAWVYTLTCAGLARRCGETEDARGLYEAAGILESSVLKVTMPDCHDSLRQDVYNAASKQAASFAPAAGKASS